MPAKRYLTPEGKDKPGTAAIKEYMESNGHEPVKLAELKELMPSMGGPGTEELGDLCAIELGWTLKES